MADDVQTIPVASPASLPLLRRLIVACLVSVAVTLVDASSSSAAAPAGLVKRSCVRAVAISELPVFESLVGRAVDCVVTFNDAASTWSQWENPWLIRSGADTNWAGWASARPGARRLVISQRLIPASLNATDWRRPGADGVFADHARTLARNLIAAGQGNAVIRLSWEANGTWYPDSIGNTAQEKALWVRFWRRTVLAMKAVPGAAFVFDWCINAGFRSVPLADYYPGDDVVDLVGIDAYDSQLPDLPAGGPRWNANYSRSSGIGEALAFARGHGKPLSIPEWGIAPRGSTGFAGDDPEYVDGIAGIVRDNDVAYQGYFFAREFAQQLTEGGRSLAAYRRHFGATGDAARGPEASGPSAAPAFPAIAQPLPTANAPGAPTSPLTGAPATPSAAAPPASAATPAVGDTTTRSGRGAATLLASSVAAQLSRLNLQRGSTATVTIPARVRGIACLSVLRDAAPVVLACRDRLIRVVKGRPPEVVTAPVPAPRRMAGGGTSRTSRLRMRVAPVPGTALLTVVSAVLPEGGTGALSVATHTLRVRR